jgi:hypothetical protein
MAGGGKQGVLFVSNPNYPVIGKAAPPAAEEEIDFDHATGRFNMYDPGDGKYTEVYYVGKKAIINWFELGLDWGTMDAALRFQAQWA